MAQKPVIIGTSKECPAVIKDLQVYQTLRETLESNAARLDRGSKHGIAPNAMQCFQKRIEFLFDKALGVDTVARLEIEQEWADQMATILDGMEAEMRKAIIAGHLPAEALPEKTTKGFVLP